MPSGRSMTQERHAWGKVNNLTKRKFRSGGGGRQLCVASPDTI